jgi:neutral ceramidase
MTHRIASAIATTLLVAAAPVGARAPGTLQAGAARIEITPPVKALNPGDSIHDPLFVRALVIRNHDGCAVLVGVDQGGVRDAVANPAIERAAAASGCARDGFIVSATHTHSGSTGGLGGGGEPSGKVVEDAIVEAVRRADAARRPARIGYGTGRIDLNVNRDLFVQNRWTQGPNEDAGSDKTLAVIELLDARDLPIGVYVNYAMHPVNYFLSGVISADFPGEVSRYIEKRYGRDMVAIFAQGASGDQNPRLQRPYNALAALRTGARDVDDKRLTAPAPWLRAPERNAVTRMMQAVKQPLPADRLPAYRAAIADLEQLVTAEGAVIAETAINTMRFGMTDLSGSAEIAAAHEDLQCPGRDRLDAADPVRENAVPPYADGAPVHLKVGMVRIGRINLGWVNGEVYSGIAMRLKREAPVSDLLVTTLANGAANSGYIYSNEAGSHLTFQVISSRLKPGCAEDGIVGAGLRLIETMRR